MSRARIDQRVAVEAGGGVETMREMVRKVWKRRFGVLAQEFAARIEGIDDPAKLDQLVEQVLDGEPPEDISW